MSGSPLTYYTQVDLQSIPVLNLVAETRTSDGSSLVAGRFWFRTDTKKLSVYDGTAVQTAVFSGAIVNADVASGAAIAYSKLALGTSIVNADVSASAAIAYSKLALGTSIVNADVSASAGIVYSKLSLTTSIVNGDISGSAAIAESKLNLATDAAAGTGSRRTIGTGATQAMAGNTTLSSIAAPTGSVAMSSQKLTGLTAGTTSGDSVEYAQMNTAIASAVSGQDWKASVRAATTAPGTLATSFANGQVIDGITLATGDRILIKNQSAGAENGIYVVAVSGAPTRATDADNSPAGEVTQGMTVPVEGGGSTLGGTIWLLTNSSAITLGSTALTFTQIGGSGTTYTGSTGVALVGNDFRIENSGVLTVAHGGTASSSASGARTALSTPVKGAVVAVPALTAGVEATIAHTTGTANALCIVRKISDGSQVAIGIRTGNATNVFITSDVAVSSSTLELVYSPIDG